MYSGPSFLFSFTCSSAIFFALSSVISINEGSEKNDEDCCVPNALENDPCICGAKDMGPCVAMLSGWPKGPRGICEFMNESTRCALKEPAVVIESSRMRRTSRLQL